ncbi:NAD(P)H-dependent flavin oxidoreductase [Myroides pelagicus]|uniref:Propionate 3-nitronate monooxygenase n=1 Tax=Myroides pelagicus TaxID=270914 RepID=A0A7K1GJV3_9FLAO|nr:nitronate monooxygenase [Myroides pelagicus]MEC4114144.1 nitronate monooxygenase [Myroides pelagicus]MTH28504.1 nitronate monooxygenase [Myroides pelagicus]
MRNLKDILGIEHSIGQAPMLGVTTPAMVAAIANEGGLGTLPLGGLPVEMCDKLIKQTKELTNKPFAVNVFLNPLVTQDDSQIDLMQHLLSKVCLSNNIPYTQITEFKQDTYMPLVELAIAHGIKVICFTFGCFTPPEIERLHQEGIYLIGTATTLEEAQYLSDHTIDAITLQGIEAGGHRGSFLHDTTEQNLPLDQLFNQVINSSIDKPLIVTGGLYKGSQARKYIDKGAAFATFGSLFIASDESNAMDYQKNLLSKGTPVKTKLTKSFSGKWARGIDNNFMELIDQSNISIPPYPIQNILTQNIRFFAKQKNIPNFNSLWCGINSHFAAKHNIKHIFNKLTKEFYEY